MSRPQRKAPITAPAALEDDPEEDLLEDEDDAPEGDEGGEDEDDSEASDDDTEDDSAGNDGKRKRRFRSPHPGVKIKPPRKGCRGKVCSDRSCKSCKSADRVRMPYYRGVYEDPDQVKNGKPRTIYEKLDPKKYPNNEARVRWAKKKSRQLAKRRRELDDGATPASGTSFDECFGYYFDKSKSKKDATRAKYRTGTKKFMAWMKDEAPRVTPDTLRRTNMIDFRAWLFVQPKYVGKAGGKRGEKIDSGELRSPASFNSDLRSVRAVLRWLRTAERLPHLSLEDIYATLPFEKENELKPVWYTPATLRSMVEAAQRHDAELMPLTAEQKANGDTTRVPRYTPITPLVLGIMLTGMRLDEACLIEFNTHLFLDETDYAGNKMPGKIMLREQDTKTHRSREVSCDIAPMLHDLLVALKRRAGGKGPVFGVTYHEARAALDRMRDEYGAPENFTWQGLRQNCDAYLNCAPGLYGSSVAAYRAATQIGHSVKVSEKYYASLIKGIPPELKTLEAVLQIEKPLAQIIANINGNVTEGNVVKLGRRRR